MKVKTIIFTPSPLGIHLSETNSFDFLLWIAIFSSNHWTILSFQKLLSSACGCVANKSHITCYINDTVIHFCFKGHISSSNCKSTPFKYISVLNYSVKKGKSFKYLILLSGYRGKLLDILSVVHGRKTEFWSNFYLQTLEHPERIRHLARLWLDFLVRLKIYVEKMVRGECRGAGGKRKREGERERKRVSSFKNPRCTIRAKGE